MDFPKDINSCSKSRLFVGGVPIKFEESSPTLTSENLKEYFASFGSLAYFKLAKNKKTKESLGFGFLEYKEEASYHKVLSMRHKINEREVDQYLIKIDVKPFKKGSEINAQDADLKKRKLFVKNLPASCNNKKLLAVFSAFGKVDKAYILFDHKTGCSRGFGFVEYLHEEELARALDQGVSIDGKVIQCSRVFLKQEAKEKETQQAMCQTVPNLKTKAQKEKKSTKEKQTGSSNVKTSVPDMVTQESLGGSSTGDWEKDQYSPILEPITRPYQDQAQFTGHRSGKRFFSCEQWEQYSVDGTDVQKQQPFLGPVGTLPYNPHAQSGYNPTSYAPEPRSVLQSGCWTQPEWYPPEQEMRYYPQPQSYHPKPRSYYRMF